MSKESKEAIAIDFDGVISYYNGFHGIGVFGPPVKGVQEGLAKIQKAGYWVVIHTTRGEKTSIMEYLQRHHIPFDYINHSPINVETQNQGKPVAKIYLDDRGMRFDGEWTDEFVDVLLNTEPWWK